MTTPSISREVERLTDLNIDGSTDFKADKYLEILTQTSFTIDNIREFVVAVINIPYGTAIIREVLNKLIALLQNKGLNWQDEETILLFLLDKISPMIMSYEDQDVAARLRLADLYEQNDENIKASTILEQGVTRRVLKDESRFEWYIRIVRNRLEVDDSTSAEGFIKRAALLRPKLKAIDPSLQIHFLFSQARIADSNRNFVDAARKYYEVSIKPDVDPAEQMACLESAITCVILAPAGPMRNQILLLIFNDDRTQSFPEYEILKKLYTNRLLMNDELKNFESKLLPHQKASLADGLTVLRRSMIDHNLVAVSRIYSSISIEQLGKLLGLDSSQVEDYAGKMILQGRLAAAIDQVYEIVQFKRQDDINNLRRWESKIKTMCSDLDHLVNDITRLQNSKA